MKANSGSILIITLWVLSILTIYSIGIGCNISSQVNFASYFKNRLVMYYLAKAGIQRATAELFMDETINYDTLSDNYSNNKEIFKENLLESGHFTVSYDLKDKDGEKTHILYGAMDEGSKININRVPKEALESLLKTLGEVEDIEASDIADAIVDWRDVDIFPSINGAEDDHYTSLDTPYECKDRDFEALEELLLVKGMTKDIFLKIKDAITIYGEGRVNINTASFSTFYALGGDESLAERIVEFRDGSDEIPGTEDDNIFETVEDLREIGPLFTEESIILNRLISLNVLSVISNVFRINSFGILKRGDNDLRRKIACVVKRKKEEQDFEILYWHEE